MSLELSPVQPDDVPELGRIAYDAFAGISSAHGFAPDFPDAAAGARILGLLATHPGCYGVAARREGRLVGSNFVSLTDPVGAIGPITVDPAAQGHGIGRALMEDVMAEARRRGLRQMRLMQDSFNAVSLSLYASLGFEARESVALLQLPEDAPAEGSGVRPATEADLPALSALSVARYRTDRRGDLQMALACGFPALVREEEGRITGYLLPGLFGHGVEECVDGMMDLIRAAQTLPPPFARFFCPLRQHALFRRALAGGCRVLKVMTLMAWGPYEEPQGVWMPSVGY